MPKLIEYSNTDSFDPLISWLNRNKPNVKYTLKAEYVKDGEKHEADCGSLIGGDPVMPILYDLLSNSLYSTGSGVINPTVGVYTNTTGTTNVNASTSWLSTSYTFNGYTSDNFSITFSTTISSAVSGTATVNALVLYASYGQYSSGSAQNFLLDINTQGGTACNINVSAGNVITWTLSGSIKETMPSVNSSWFIELWSEIWAEFIAATGVSGAPTGLWQYPPAGTPLFNGYDIIVYGLDQVILGNYTSSNASGTAISNATLNPGTNPSTTTGLSYAPSISFIFTPTSSNTIEEIVSHIYINGTKPSSPSTLFAASGLLTIDITNINQSVSAGQQYSITLTDNISVSQNT